MSKQLNQSPGRSVNLHLVAQEASGERDAVVVVIVLSAAARVSRVEAAMSWNFILA